jgi:hypothetical protein
VKIERLGDAGAARWQRDWFPWGSRIRVRDGEDRGEEVREFEVVEGFGGEVDLAKPFGAGLFVFFAGGEEAVDEEDPRADAEEAVAVAQSTEVWRDAAMAAARRAGGRADAAVC